MIFQQVWRIMFIGLAEQVVRELRELLLPSSLLQMQSLRESSLRFCKKRDKSSPLHCLHWLALVVQILEVIV